MKDLIEKYRGLAVQTAQRLSHHPSNLPDLIGEANLALFKTASYISTHPEQFSGRDLNSYVASALFKEVKKARRKKLPFFKVDIATYHKLQSQGKEIPTVAFKFDMSQLVSRQDHHFDLEEAKSKLALNDTELKVLEGRLEGKTDEQIGIELSTTKAWIWQVRKKLQQRYNQIFSN